MGNNPIEQAIDYESAIEIIPNEVCQQGIYFLQQTLVNIVLGHGPTALVWIDRGGETVGRSLLKPIPEISLPENRMRMSHTNENNQFMEQAVCVDKPDYNKIIRPNGTIKTIVLADNVVETKGSFMGARDVIAQDLNELSSHIALKNTEPIFYYLALVSKISSDWLPNLTAAFLLNNQIWAHGLDCDDGDRGREKRSIWGRLKPSPDYIPTQPYYLPRF